MNVVRGIDPFDHPDAQRRFRIMTDADELARALDYPWDKWTVFLHPAQRQIVEKDYNGPVRVSGTAGTGKTIVALHRAVHLARNHPDARVLLTTFSEMLANALRAKLRRLTSNEPRLTERLEVHAIDSVGKRLYETQLGRAKIASRGHIQQLLNEASGRVPECKFSARFLLGEWEDVVDDWQLKSWEAYRDVKRLGRGRSQTLRINYRTSHQIRMQADRLLGQEVLDVDGNVDDRRGTVSVFNGPSPDIWVFDTIEEEAGAVEAWLKDRNSEGIAPHEIGIFVRSTAQIERAKSAAHQSGITFNLFPAIINKYYSTLI